MVYCTHDIGLAAFLMIKGMPLKSCHIDDRGRYNFEFDDPDNKADVLAIEFINSECSRFDNQMRNLRKILKKP